jgi:hypothetical protein
MKLAIYFGNKWYTMSMVSWGFLTNHARVLLCIARDPGVLLRDIASSLGITERSAHGFVTGQPGQVTLTPAASASQSRKVPEPAGRQHAGACADPDGLRHWPGCPASDPDVGGIRSASRPMRTFRTQSGCFCLETAAR